MKLLLFLDDWFLDVKNNVVRRYAKAESVPLPHKEALELARSSVIYDPDKRRFRAWSKRLKSARAWLWESPDGMKWRRTRHSMRVFKNQNFPFEQGWTYDPWDDDPERRYKMLAWPYPEGNKGGAGLLAFSKDGVKWNTRRDLVWYPEEAHGSDTINNIFYNPLAKKWSVVCRKVHADRRVALTSSPDLLNWSPPRVVVHPDPLDPDGLQFYGMKATLYEDEYFIGLLQCFQVPNNLEGWLGGGRVKMDGTVDMQLTYSYDGELWSRSDRSVLIQRESPGEFGSSCVYSHAMLNAPDDRIFIYSIGTTQDHGSHALPRRPGPTEKMLLHTLRKDGFTYLESRGGWGRVATKAIVPRKPELTVNYEAPSGFVEVQVSRPDGEPVPGCRFKDCIPLQGDQVRGAVRWKRRKSLRGLLGKPVRIEFRLRDARLYAVRLDCQLWHTGTKEPIERP